MLRVLRPSPVKLAPVEVAAKFTLLVPPPTTSCVPVPASVKLSPPVPPTTLCCALALVLAAVVEPVLLISTAVTLAFSVPRLTAPSATGLPPPTCSTVGVEGDVRALLKLGEEIVATAPAAIAELTPVITDCALASVADELVGIDTAPCVVFEPAATTVPVIVTTWLASAPE